MGRKKKETEQPKVSEQKEKETNKSTSGSIGYQGKISVAVQRGNKTISNKTYNNNGNTNLFRFLGDCLAGTFSEENRPIKIALFNKKNTGIPEEADDFSTWVFTKSILASPLTIVYSNTPKPKIEGNTVSITYDFKIPYTYLTGSVYKVAIYSARNEVNTEVPSSNNIWNWSAAFGFLNEDGTDWEPIIISNSNKQYYTLLISWTMSIRNQIKGGNN